MNIKILSIEESTRLESKNMNINQEKLQEFIEDLNKTLDELAKTSEDQERINLFKIKHDELFCGFNIRRMNIEVNRIQNGQKKEENIKEKLIKAVSKPVNIKEDNIENLTTIQTITHYLEQFDKITSMKIYYDYQLGNLLEKCLFQGKNIYGDALKQCKIKPQWAYFLRRLYKLCYVYKKLISTTLSLRFIQMNYTTIKQICDSNQEIFK